MDSEENKRLLEHIDQQLEEIQRKLAKILADFERMQQEIQQWLEQQRRDDV